MHMSNYLEDGLLNHLLSNIPLEFTISYLALYTSDPTDAEIGIECSDVNYSRQSITFDTSLNGETSNTDYITFLPFTGDVTITHIGIMNAPIGGNLMFHVDLSTSKIMHDTDELRFHPGSLTIRLS